MIIANLCGFVCVTSSAVAVALLVHRLVLPALAGLLDETVALPACTTFLTRVHLIGLLAIALSATLKVSFDFKDGAAFMEYVWKIADGLASSFGLTCLFLFGYVVIVTVLVAAFRRRHD